MSTIVCPFHYQVYHREGASWFGKNPSKVFYNGTNKPIELENVASQFCLTDEQVVIELFRINGGKAGYYLANLRDRKYYYCGIHWEDVRATLHSCGIGKTDPLEK